MLTKRDSDIVEWEPEELRVTIGKSPKPKNPEEELEEEELQEEVDDEEDDEEGEEDDDDEEEDDDAVIKPIGRVMVDCQTPLSEMINEQDNNIDDEVIEEIAALNEVVGRRRISYQIEVEKFIPDQYFNTGLEVRESLDDYELDGYRFLDLREFLSLMKAYPDAMPEEIEGMCVAIGTRFISDQNNEKVCYIVFEVDPVDENGYLEVKLSDDGFGVGTWYPVTKTPKP